MSLGLASPAIAQTYVSRDIAADTTWSTAGSPYVILADITVGGGAVLRIEPGVVVSFVPDTGLTIGSPVLGPGTLIATGEPDNPVLFTSELQDPVPGSWKAVVFTPEAVSAVVDNETDEYISGSLLDRCVLEFGGANAEGQLVLQESMPLLRHTVLTDSLTRGIDAMTEEDIPLRLQGCELRRNGDPTQWGGGLRVQGSEKAILDGCVFAENRAYFGGGAMLQATGSTVSRCLIQANSARSRGGGAMVYDASGVTFTDCEFRDNLAQHPDNAGTIGAGLYSEGNRTSIYRTAFVGNTATGDVAQAGAIGSFRRDLYVADCLFEGNAAIGTTIAARGGAIMQNPASAGQIILRCDFLNNMAITDGTRADAGAIYIGDSLIQACRFTDNVAGTTSGTGTIMGGAVVAVDEGARMIGNVFEGNFVGGEGVGGAVFQASADAVYAVNLFLDNEAGTAGGAMYITEWCSLEGTPRLFNRFQGNAAPRGSALCNTLAFNAFGYSDIPAAYTCWGTSDTGEIEQAIYHYFDDDMLSIIGYWPLADCGATCDADWEGDGDVDTGDVLAFLGAWASFDEATDVTRDGIIDSRDIIRFLQTWAEGC